MTRCVCGHPADSHGDRAVVGCIREITDEDTWRTMGQIVASRCPCNGYQGLVPSENEHLQPGPVPD